MAYISQKLSRSFVLAIVLDPAPANVERVRAADRILEDQAVNDVGLDHLCVA